MHNHVILFESAIEWSSYRINRKIWTFEDDIIYKNTYPSWYDGKNRFWASSVYKSLDNQVHLCHSAVVNEDDDNQVWLVYGSYSEGIYIVDLNDESELLKINPDIKTWKERCNSIHSAYNIRVGLSLSPTGPFYDKKGKDLARGEELCF